MPVEIVVCGVPFGSPCEGEALKQLKDLGVTSVQIYTFWKEFEPAGRERFDWSHYDRQVEALGRAGLKYVPFLLMGPKYAAPSWWLESPSHRGLVCLEHGKTSPIESIWSPVFREEISRVMAAFAAHYLPWGVLESVQPGICGDYGEAIMPVLGNWPGDYHTHRGWWCGGKDAVADLRAWLQRRFNSINALNLSWRSHYASFDEIRPFLPHRTSSRTAWFDQLEWYRASMTDYAEFWMSECRRLFPQLPAYMCTGGSEEPEHASLFSSQARIAARHGGGIRLTNEGNKFYDNFATTAYTWSACDHYGAYLGLEPVGPITEKGVTARIFGSAAYGNRQMFHYFGNLFDGQANPLPAATSFKRYISLVQPAPSPEAAAFFWPGDLIAWQGGIPESVGKALAYIRRRVSVMPVNEEMVLDGALARHKLLVVALPGFTDRRVLLAIAAWVQAGGTLLAAGRLLDRELEPVLEYDALFGILSVSEEAIGHHEQEMVGNLLFPRFCELGRYHTQSGWMDLAPEVIPLSQARAEEGYSGTKVSPVTAAFTRQAGEGRTVFYCGPATMQDDPEAIFPDPGAFQRLLEDMLVQSGGVELLTPAPGEIARARIGGKMHSLLDGEIQVNLSTPQPYSPASASHQ
jgi:hypothetical protein